MISDAFRYRSGDPRDNDQVLTLVFWTGFCECLAGDNGPSWGHLTPLIMDYKSITPWQRALSVPPVNGRISALSTSPHSAEPIRPSRNPYKTYKCTCPVCSGSLTARSVWLKTQFRNSDHTLKQLRKIKSFKYSSFYHVIRMHVIIWKITWNFLFVTLIIHPCKLLACNIYSTWYWERERESYFLFGMWTYICMFEKILNIKDPQINRGIWTLGYLDVRWS